MGAYNKNFSAGLQTDLIRGLVSAMAQASQNVVAASNNLIQGPVVQKVTNTIHWINLYSVPNNHLLASDLSTE